MRLSILALSLCFVMAACGSKGSSPVTAAKVDPAAPGVSQPGPTPTPALTSSPSPTPTPSPSPSPSPTTSTVSLTYYALTTQAVVPPECSVNIPQFEYQTGYCAVYNSQTYCWDDGLHYAGNSFTGLGDCKQTFAPNGWGYFFWSNFINYAGYDQIVDPFTNPVNMGTTTLFPGPTNLPDPDYNMGQLLDNGTPTTVTCTVSTTQVVCPTFTIEL